MAIYQEEFKGIQVDSDHKKAAYKQIRNLLGVILGGVFAAILFTLFLIHYYGPSGRYVAKNVLLAPKFMEGLSYNDINPKTGESSRFIFNGLEFSFYSPREKQWHKMNIDQEEYRKFYEVVGGEQSIPEVTDEIRDLFAINPSQLILTVRTESNAKWDAATKVFQEVHFINKGNYFRVRLRETNQTTNWAYFYYLNIFDEVLEIFTPTHEHT